MGFWTFMRAPELVDLLHFLSLYEGENSLAVLSEEAL